MDKNRWAAAGKLALLILLAANCLFVLAGTARGDSGTYSMTGGFTTFFSDNVGGNADPNYVRGIAQNEGTICGSSCSDPLFGFTQLCPAAGCNTDGGASVIDSLLVGSAPSNFVTFESFGCPPTASPICANPANELDFVPDPNPSILSFDPNTGQTEMLLGTLTFTNGTFSGNADLGFTVTATDVANSQISHTFTGSIHMQLNIAPPGITNPGQAAQENADCISLTDAAGQPVSTFVDRNFCAYESSNGLGLPNTTTVNLYGTIGSLDPTRFGDVTGGFIVDSAGNLIQPVTSTPEPSSWPLIMAALVIGAVVYQRRGRPTKQAS
jgi:hypothetical protein